MELESITYKNIWQFDEQLDWCFQNAESLQNKSCKKFSQFIYIPLKKEEATSLGWMMLLFTS